MRQNAAMLVLTRKSNQSIMIGDDIEVSVLSIIGERVRIGIQAPRNIPVFRKEVYLVNLSRSRAQRRLCLVPTLPSREGSPVGAQNGRMCCPAPPPFPGSLATRSRFG
jgi:carbon storage regulator CsrA